MYHGYRAAQVWADLQRRGHVSGGFVCGGAQWFDLEDVLCAEQAGVCEKNVWVAEWFQIS